MKRDTLTIGPITARVHIGCSTRERKTTQPIRIDVAFDVDMRRAAKRDDLALTVDYDIAQKVIKLAEASSCKLLETLATRIADLCLTELNACVVRVRVQKQLPFDRSIAGAVEIERGV